MDGFEEGFMFMIPLIIVFNDGNDGNLSLPL